MTEQNSDQKLETDLLGDPIDLARDNWGRKEFQKTEENQRLVIVLSAAKWTQERIARQIGCDAKTLRKHFSRELTEAADILEAQALKQVMKKLCQGNMAAVNKTLGLVESARALPPKPASQDDDGAAAEDTVKDAPKGKKEALAEAAQTPGSAWGNLLKH